jgi:hypothetical protein
MVARSPLPRGSLLRSMLVGLGAGTLMGAIYLSARAIHGSRLQCPELSAEECAFEQATAAELARWQGLVAVALALVSVALFLLLRARARRNSDMGGRT